MRRLRDSADFQGTGGCSAELWPAVLILSWQLPVLPALPVLPLSHCAGQFCVVWWPDAALLRWCWAGYFEGGVNFQIEIHWFKECTGLRNILLGYAHGSSRTLPCIASKVFLFLPFQSEMFCFSSCLYISAFNVFKCIKQNIKPIWIFFHCIKVQHFE